MRGHQQREGSYAVVVRRCYSIAVETQGHASAGPQDNSSDLYVGLIAKSTFDRILFSQAFPCGRRLVDTRDCQTCRSQPQHSALHAQTMFHCLLTNYDEPRWQRMTFSQIAEHRLAFHACHDSQSAHAEPLSSDAHQSSHVVSASMAITIAPSAHPLPQDFPNKLQRLHYCET